ncbi:MAG: PH domain-containing protein [Bacteroidetes bacterium]|nr:PH domain-containing protein [Bacteroidota bacterium]
MISIESKKGWDTYLFLLLMLIPIFMGIWHSDWGAIALGIGLFMFVFVTVFSIRYTMDEEFLYIYSFFFLYKKVEIKRIYKIEKTWNLISSPAPSVMGRVEIYWPAYNSIVISPKDFDYFKQELLQRNPNIEVKG